MKAVTNICIACGYKPITGMACPRCAEKDKVTYHATAKQEAEKMASVPIKINKDLSDEFWEDVKDAFFGAREKKEQWEKTLDIYKCVGCGEPAYPNKAGLADQCENCFDKKEEKSAPTATCCCHDCGNRSLKLFAGTDQMNRCASCHENFRAQTASVKCPG